MEEKMKALALSEFGTLDGVTITYSIDTATGRVVYCFTRLRSDNMLKAS